MTDIFLQIGMTIISLAAAWAVRHFHLEGAKRDAIEALSEGVSHSYRSFVKGRMGEGKTKLNDEEKEKARTIATKEGYKIASGAAKRVMAKWSTSKIETLIEALVQHKKRK